MEDEMTALKSLTFTTLPTQGANPILDRRAKVISRLRGAEADSKRPELHSQKSDLGQEGRRKSDGRKAAASVVVVATASERLLCVLRSEWVEGNRVRKRQ